MTMIITNLSSMEFSQAFVDPEAGFMGGEAGEDDEATNDDEDSHDERPKVELFACRYRPVHCQMKMGRCGI
jgi:hypothetical protein